MQVWKFVSIAAVKPGLVTFVLLFLRKTTFLISVRSFPYDIKKTIIPNGITIKVDSKYVPTYVDLERNHWFTSFNYLVL